MLLVSLRDLQWRRRRFLIAIVAAALVFAMTLLLSGVNNTLHQEPKRIVNALGADAFVVPSGSSGPFTSTNTVDTSRAEELLELPGVTEVTPFAYFHATLEGKDMNVLGLGSSALQRMDVKNGRTGTAAGEVMASTQAPVDVGDEIEVAGSPMTVVGTTRQTTFNFGVPTLLVTIEDAQKMLFSGAPLATAFMIRGTPTSAPDGLRVMSVDDVIDDMRRPIKQGASSIQFINVLLWIVAAGIIGSIVYLSSLERVGDFAVLKATGTSTRTLVMGLALQAVILCAASALVAAVLVQFLKPGFPFDVEITFRSYVTLPLIAVVVGLLASLAGLRRAVAVDPALAFG
jgi:putative ABC transport system permease protein